MTSQDSTVLNQLSVVQLRQICALCKLQISDECKRVIIGRLNLVDWRFVLNSTNGNSFRPSRL